MRGMSAGLVAVLVLCGWFGALTQAEEAPARTEAGGMIPAEVKGVFQVSTLQALLEGCYDGVITAGELTKHGNFGIGTFEGLDGEMVVLNGEVWQVRADGAILQMPDTAKIPFGNVARGMLPSVSLLAKSPLLRTDVRLAAFPGLKELQQQIEAKIVNRNLPQLVVAEGVFLQMQTRSVPGQQKPYPRLAEVAKKQSVFRSEKVRGTLVGYWFPEYFKGINLPGFHLHFLSDDRKSGGHVLDCVAAEGVLVTIFPQTEFRMQLPAGGDFAQKNIAQDKAAELHQIEGK